MGFALGVIFTVMIGLVIYLIHLERKHRKEREIKKDKFDLELLADAVSWTKDQINGEYSREGSFSSLGAETILNTFSYYHPGVSIQLDSRSEGIQFTLGCGKQTEQFFALYHIPYEHLIHNWVYKV